MCSSSWERRLQGGWPREKICFLRKAKRHVDCSREILTVGPFSLCGTSLRLKIPNQLQWGPLGKSPSQQRPASTVDIRVGKLWSLDILVTCVMWASFRRKLRFRADIHTSCLFCAHFGCWKFKGQSWTPEINCIAGIPKQEALGARMGMGRNI